PFSTATINGNGRFSAGADLKNEYGPENAISSTCGAFTDCGFERSLPTGRGMISCSLDSTSGLTTGWVALKVSTITSVCTLVRSGSITVFVPTSTPQLDNTRSRPVSPW